MTDGSCVLTPIARIHSDFTTKFGVPRQPGLASSLEAEIIFEPGFRNPDMLRGIEGYSHLWLIWQFSENADRDWSPTVRPPRLGGNVRMGVLATRSPFRPNFLGLSCVKLLRVERRTVCRTSEDVDKSSASGSGQAVLVVSGADLVNGTPIYDIKPYIPYSDCVPDASEGYSPMPTDRLDVEFLNGADSLIPAEKLQALTEVLSLDPRPRYHDDPDREYGMGFAGLDIHFKVCGSMLSVTSVS